MKQKVFSILALLLMAASGAMAQTYSVTLKSGTEDAENWTISDGTKTAKGNEGLSGLNCDGNYDMLSSMTSDYLTYWSSSEYSANHAVNLRVNATGTGGNVGFRWDYSGKAYAGSELRVRPVLAF